VQAEARLRPYQERVEARLGELLPPADAPPTELNEAMRYSCLAPGKRMRPALCLASAAAVGDCSPEVLDAACAIEMVHCFSLIQDDLPAMDDDDLRRGLPTCHKRFGEAVAILASDSLFALAFETLAEEHVDSYRKLRAIAALARASGTHGLAGGQAVDLDSEGREADISTVDFIMKRKTGALIAASCEIGGLLGGAHEPQVDALRNFGSHIGFAFQIADDLLNELSSAEVLGKAVGSDRQRKKATYPFLLGIDAARARAQASVETGISMLRAEGIDSVDLECFATYAVERIA
jgi:geranylgeranyl diphosphate synthase type II